MSIGDIFPSTAYLSIDHLLHSDTAKPTRQLMKEQSILYTYTLTDQSSARYGNDTTPTPLVPAARAVESQSWPPWVQT